MAQLNLTDGMPRADFRTNINANFTELYSQKAPLASPTFTGTVSGITAAMVGLGNVDNTADTGKPVSTAQQTALDLKANLASPTFTGTVAGITAAMVGLGNVTNTSDANKPVSTAQQTALNLKANLASPTFTGTVGGITAAMVGLGNVTNTSDANKPVSTAQQTALDLKAPLASPTFTGTVSGISKTMVGLGNADNTADAVKPSPGSLTGLTLANNGTDATNDIDIAIGTATNSTNLVSMVLASALTKQLDAAWAVGTNAGGRMSAAAITDTTYHVFLIRRPDTGVVDVGFDVSPTAPTMPANYTQFRRIGSIVRKSGAIVGFSQNGDEFLLTGGVAVDAAAVSLGNTAQLQTLTVPTGIKVEALVSAAVQHGTLVNRCILFTSPDQQDQAPGNIGQIWIPIAAQYIAANLRLRTNTSGQIRARGDTTGFAMHIGTYGWVDARR